MASRERTLNAVLVGAESSRGELSPVLSRAGFSLRELADLPGAGDGPSLVCIALDHPDQFAGDDVRRFLATAVGARIICVRFPWCASMLRSRCDWPAAVVVDVAEFEKRLDNEKQVLLGKRPPLPITAGLEEVAAFNRAARLLLIGLATAMSGFVLSGCGGSSSSSAPKASTTKASWAEQVQSVRSGASKKIISAAPSKSDWDMLKTDCSALEVLEVEGAVSAETDFTVLTGLSNLQRLKVEGGLNDTQAAAISGHPKIAEILVDSNSLTDQGLIALCRLPLVQLRLRAPKVTDGSMADVGKLKQLRFLHLIDVPITDAALPALAQVQTLESLYLDRAKCTDEGLSALLKQRPDIHFHRDQTHLRDDPKKDGH
jgi:hypothetical protein